MATIRLKVGLAGTEFALASGELYTCPDAVAERFVAAGQAEYVDGDAVESATVSPSEMAVRVEGPPKGRRLRGTR